MANFDKWIMGALGLILVYLILTSENTSSLFSSFASGTSQIFSTLQGR